MAIIALKWLFYLVLLYVFTIGLYVAAEIVYVSLIAAKAPVTSEYYRDLLNNEFYLFLGMASYN